MVKAPLRLPPLGGRAAPLRLPPLGGRVQTTEECRAELARAMPRRRRSSPKAMASMSVLEQHADAQRYADCFNKSPHPGNLTPLRHALARPTVLSSLGRKPAEPIGSATSRDSRFLMARAGLPRGEKQARWPSPTGCFGTGPMPSKKHTYVFAETYLCFFKNIPMFFQKHTYDFPKTYL